MSSYILGHEPDELARLDAQHELWRDTLLPVLEASIAERHAALGRPVRVLEVGCGTGALIADLLSACGERCSVLGVELDASSASTAAERVAGCGQAEIRVGDVGRLDAVVGADERFDLIVARWLFIFLADPAAALAQLAGVLADEGRIVVQDYNHDGVRVFPDTDGAIATTIDATRAHWRREAGDLWIGARLPQHAAGLGLDVLDRRADIKAGDARSGVWSWVGRFLHGHVDALVATGDLSPSERHAFERGWSEAAATPGATIFSPIVVTTVFGRVTTAC